MELERKYISKENWERVIEKETACIPIEYEKLQGEAFLIKVKKVKEPLYKTYNKKNGIFCR